MFLEHQGVSPEVSGDLILATSEACNNAFQHSGDGAELDVSVSYLDGTVTIEVADRGRGFDFEKERAEWPPILLRSGGRGLYIIAEVTDQVEVVRRQPGTLVRMFKTVT